MKCKFCQADLEEGVTLCPNCGKENADTAPKSAGKKKFKVWQLVLMIVGCVALLLSLSAVVYCSIIGVESFDEGVESIVRLFTPRENNVYYKDSYTVSEKKAQAKRDEVVATVGDQKLTNGQLQIYYWMNVYDFLNNYGYYAVYAGLDYTKPLDEQACVDSEGSWQQYFLEDSLSNWHKYQSMANMAQAQGMKLSEDMQKDLDGLRENLAVSAAQNGYGSIDAMLQSDMGPGCTFEDYHSYMQVYYWGYMYFGAEYEKLEITDEMLEEYFAAHEKELAEQKITKDSGSLVDIRHILIEPEGGKKNEDGDMVYSEAEWEECRVTAQNLLDIWLDGEHTEKSFAELANKHSADPGSNTVGGLYTDVKKGQMTENFEKWCFDESRNAGDYGLVKTEFGYHIMYFVDSEAQWIAACRDGINSDKSNEIVAAATAQYPMEINFKKIVLGDVDLKKSSK